MKLIGPLILASFIFFNGTRGSIKDEGNLCWYLNFCSNSFTGQSYCGNVLIPPLSCSCDSDCRLFGDCCFRYESHCEKTSLFPKFFHNHGEIECRATEHNRISGKDYKGVYIVSSCPPMFSGDKKLSLMCDLVNRKKDLYVEGKVYYKNRFCAQCWENYKNHPLIVKLSNRPRPCIPSLNTCLKSKYTNPDFAMLTQSCNAHILPILVRNFSSGSSKPQTIRFKNADCLACSNQQYTQDDGICYDPYKDEEDLGPESFYPFSPLMSEEEKSFPFNSFSLADYLMKNFFNHGVPDSISVMISFGLNFKKHMYSADNWFHKCKNHYIWDPFSKVCRRVYCRSDLDLMSYYCGESGNNGTNLPNGVHLIQEYQMTLPSKKVSINITARVKVSGNGGIESLINLIYSHFFERFANIFSICKSRLSELEVKYIKTETLGSQINIFVQLLKSLLILTNEGIYDSLEDLPSSSSIQNALNTVKENHEVYIFQLTFYLDDVGPDSYEYKTDDLMSTLADLTMQNSLVVTLTQKTALVVTAIQEHSIYDEEDIWFWCRGGNLRAYLNEQFEVKLNKSDDGKDWSMSVHILSSDQWYESGSFIANLLFRGVYHDPVTNVTGIVKVCEDRAQLNDSNCERMLFSFNEFQWSKEAQIIKYIGPKRFGVKHNLEAWEYTVHRSGVEVCVSLNINTFGLDYILETWLSLIVMSVSLLCLFITFIAYCLFPELRNLPGLNLMGLILSTFAYQLTFITGVNRVTSSNNPKMCVFVSIFIHYLILTMFSWTNVIAWDLFRTFGLKGLVAEGRPKKLFIKYTLYALGMPFLIVSLALICNDLGGVHMDYGLFTCWIGDPRGNLLFFGLPLAVCTIANLGLYIFTAIGIHKTGKVIENNRFSSSFSSNSSSISFTSRQDQDRRRLNMKNVFLYMRIFGVLGITWFIGIIGIFFDEEGTEIERVVLRFLVYSHVVCNGLYGVVIFAIFTCNQRVYNLFKLKFGSKARVVNDPNQPKCSCRNIYALRSKRCGGHDCNVRTLSCESAASRNSDTRRY